VLGGFRKRLSEAVGGGGKKGAPGLEDRRSTIIKMRSISQEEAPGAISLAQASGAAASPDERRRGRAGRRGSLSELIASLATLGAAASPDGAQSPRRASGDRSPTEARRGTVRRLSQLASGSFGGPRRGSAAAGAPVSPSEASRLAQKGGQRTRRGTLCDGALQA